MSILMRIIRRPNLYHTSLSNGFSTVVAPEPRRLSLRSMGRGYLGSLGHGHFQDLAAPTKVEFLNEDEADDDRKTAIVDISMGWAHGGLVTNDGRVWLFGRSHGFKNTTRLINYQRALPWIVQAVNRWGFHSSVEYPTPVPLALPKGERAQNVMCSAALTTILTTSGKILTLGANAYGQCGVGRAGQDVWTPTQVLGLEHEVVVDMAPGLQHVVVCTEEGRVFAWGKSERGQLGTGYEECTSALAVEYFDQRQQDAVTRVGSGLNYSVALTTQGQLYGWGKLFGKKLKQDQSLPREMNVPGRVVDFACSQFHTLFRTDDDRFWFIGRKPHRMGRDEHGTLITENAAMCSEPEEVFIELANIKSLSRGIDTTGILTENGELYTWHAREGLDPVAGTSPYTITQVEMGYESILMMTTH